LTSVNFANRQYVIYDLYIYDLYIYIIQQEGLTIDLDKMQPIRVPAPRNIK